MRQSNNERRFTNPYGTPSSWFPRRYLHPRSKPAVSLAATPHPGAIVLGHDIGTRAPVWLSPEPRGKGLYVLGIQGMGKSSLLEDLIVQDMQAGHGLCLLDPHRDLVEKCLARVPADREQDVILLDVRDTTRPFGINLFDCKNLADPQVVAETRQRVMRIFQRLWGHDDENQSLGINLEELLSRTTAVCIENPGLSLGVVPHLFRDAAFRARVVGNVKHADVRHFWQDTYDALPPARQQSFANSTRNKVERFLDQPIVSHIVAQKRTTFDVRAALDERRILLVALDPKLDDLTALVGSIIIELIADAAFDRLAGNRSPFFLYADECQRFATTRFDQYIPQIRKFGVNITLANQWRGQFPGAHHPMREATSGMGSFVIFRTKPEDARELVEYFSTTPHPRKQVVLDPLAVLEHDGHPNDAVHTLVRSLRRLLTALRASYEDERLQYGSSQSVSTRLAQTRDAISDYLAQAMRGELDETAARLLPGGELGAIVQRIGDYLADEPLLLPAADQIASRAEQRAHLEGELKNLERYQAQVKVLVNDNGLREFKAEHRLTTAQFLPLDTSSEAVARVARIREHSRQVYGTAVADIEADLAAMLGTRVSADNPVGEARLERGEVIDDDWD